MFGMGTQELLVIGCIVAVLFGIKRLPELGQNLGLAIKNFRGIGKELEKEWDE